MEKLAVNVAAAGLVALTALGCGADALVVQIGGQTDTLTITVVNQSSIVVSTLSLEVGDSAWLDATAANSLGIPIGNVDPTWSSTNPSVASVSGTGVVRGLAVGSSSIIASYAGVTATVPTVVADSASGGGGSAPPALYPNRPAGMGLLTQWDGTSRTNSGWQLSSDWNNHVSVRSDASNPLGTGSVLRVDFFQGSNVGPIGTINTWSGGPYNELYFMYRVYIDPNWDESSGQKLFYWGSGGFVTAHYITRESDRTLNVQDNLGLPTTMSSSDFWAGARGTWVNLEVYAKKSSSPTAADGVLRIYRNGVLRGQNAAARFPNSFQGMEWYMYRNANHTRNEYFLIGEMSVWGKN